MTSRLRKIYNSISTRIINDKNYRTTAFAATVFTIALAAIYSTPSDRITTEEETIMRVKTSPKKSIKEGLSINGISIPYNASEETLLMNLEDFITNSETSYNLRVDKGSKSKFESMYLSFEQNGIPFTKQISFDYFEPIETKELTFGGSIELKKLIIKEGGKTYEVEFNKKQSLGN